MKRFIRRSKTAIPTKAQELMLRHVREIQRALEDKKLPMGDPERGYKRKQKKTLKEEFDHG